MAGSLPEKSGNGDEFSLKNSCSHMQENPLPMQISGLFDQESRFVQAHCQKNNGTAMDFPLKACLIIFLSRENVFCSIYNHRNVYMIMIVARIDRHKTAFLP